VGAIKEAGHTVKDTCSVVGISRSGYYALKRPRACRRCDSSIQDVDLTEKIKAIKSEHPFWGYRRVRAWLMYRGKITVNEKRVRRIMREHGLMATQTVPKAKRRPQRNKPKAERPRQFWGIDMTKFMVGTIGWVYLVNSP